MKPGSWMLCLAALTAPWLGAAPFPPPGAVRFEQKIGQRLPLAAAFTDSEGRSCRLGDFFQGRPVVLFFGYARCPQLCSVVADGTVAALQQLRPSVGRDLEVVSISIDPTESRAGAAARRRQFIDWYHRPGTDDGWHYLTGAATAIRTVADAAGFHFVYDPRARLYAHPSGFIVVTPNGTVSRYFLGANFPANDLAAALERARRGETGVTVYELLLICCRGDWIGGRYGPLIWRALWISVTLTVAGLAGGIGWMLRAERRSARPKLMEGRS